MEEHQLVNRFLFSLTLILLINFAELASSLSSCLLLIIHDNYLFYDMLIILPVQAEIEVSFFSGI